MELDTGILFTTVLYILVCVIHRKRKGGLRIKGTKDTVEDTDSVDDDGGDLRDKDEGCEEEKSHEMEDKKEKERIDSLWAMFKSDTGLKSKNSGPSKAATCTEVLGNFLLPLQYTTTVSFNDVCVC